MRPFLRNFPDPTGSSPRRIGNALILGTSAQRRAPTPTELYPLPSNTSTSRLISSRLRRFPRRSASFCCSIGPVDHAAGWVSRTLTLDHTFPICAFQLKKREERAIVCNCTNLRPLCFAENRRKNGSFSKAELAMFKRLWRHTFGPQPKQLTFADQPACPFLASALISRRATFPYNVLILEQACF